MMTDKNATCSNMTEDSVMDDNRENDGSSPSLNENTSRIPRLSRSNSLKGQKRNDAKSTLENLQQISRDLKRSASFVCNTNVNSQVYSIDKNKTEYVSPYSKKAIAAERKSQSFAGLCLRPQSTPQHSIPSTPKHTMQDILPPQDFYPFWEDFESLPYPWELTPLTSSFLANTLENNDEVDDNDSEKSFDSIASAVSCDLVTLHRGRSLSVEGRGLSSGKNSLTFDGRHRKNVVHCNNSHELDQGAYLTPTQRAARKIRELDFQLKRAQRELSDKDDRIDGLVRENVKLRMKLAESSSDAAISKENINTCDVEGASALSSRSAKLYSLSSSAVIKSGSPTPKTSRPSSPKTSRPTTPTSNRSKASSQNMNETEPELRKFLNQSPGLLQHLKRSNNSLYKCSLPLSKSPSPTPNSPSPLAAASNLSQSLTDSGNFDDLPSPAGGSRSRSMYGGIQASKRESFQPDMNSGMESCSNSTLEVHLKAVYNEKLEEAKRNHMNEYNELKEKHNDHVEMLLAKLSDANLKYFELRPDLEKSQERVRDLERETSILQQKLNEREVHHHKMYLSMYMKGQQAAKMESEELQVVKKRSSRSSSVCSQLSDSVCEGVCSNGVVVSLTRQLAQAQEEVERYKCLYTKELSRSLGPSKGSGSPKVTGSPGKMLKVAGGHRGEEIDPIVTLQFLKSAVFYFFTDRENSRRHLKAIESILGYSTTERRSIGRNLRL